MKNSINSNKSQQLRKPQIPKYSNPIKNQSTKNKETSLPISRQKVEKTQILSSSSCSQCGLNSNLCLCAYQLRQPLPNVCHKRIVRQTESNSREDKIAKFAGKTFFYFVSEAIKGENNTFNTKEALQIDKKVQFHYNSCYEKTILKK